MMKPNLMAFGIGIQTVSLLHERFWYKINIHNNYNYN